VTWTAVVIRTFRLEGAGENCAEGNRDEAYNIGAEDVEGGKGELAAFEEGEGFEGVTRVSGVSGAEADGDEETPAGVGEDAFAGPDEEEGEDEAGGEVDDEGAEREGRWDEFGDGLSDEITEIRSEDGAEGDEKDGLQGRPPSAAKLAG